MSELSNRERKEWFENNPPPYFVRITENVLSNGTIWKLQCKEGSISTDRVVNHFKVGEKNNTFN